MRLLDNFSIYGSRISDNIYSDSNGQLIISNAVLARTGAYDYLESEVVPNGDPAKVVKVYRTPEEVFNPYSIASFENKPFCNDHPEEDVSGENFRELQGGFIRDVRRGTGDLSDCLVGTIVVTDPEMIDLIKSKAKRELSLGYNALIEKDDTGRYIMTHIRGNHLALVDSGRAGIATIRDRKSTNILGGNSGMKMSKPAEKLSAKESFIRKLYDSDDVIEVKELSDDETEAIDFEEDVSDIDCDNIAEVTDDDEQVDVTDDIEVIKHKLDVVEDMLQKVLTRLETKTEALDSDEEVKDLEQIEVKKDADVEEVAKTEEDVAVEECDEQPKLYDETIDEEVDEKVDEAEEDVKADDIKDGKANPYVAFANGSIKDTNSVKDMHESVKSNFQKRYDNNWRKN